MEVSSKAEVVGYCFAQACEHTNGVTGQGIHISFNAKEDAINVFLDVRHSINFYLGMKRAIEALERDGSEASKSIIRDKKAFEKMMSEMYKT